MQQTATTLTNSGFPGLLKSWRQTRKFSQLALAIEANVSQRHVSFLELGRAKPSRNMVLQLAETLEVPLRERNLLLQSAGFSPAFGNRDLDSEDMSAVKKALTLMLKHHEPYPAMVIDRDWNAVMANDALNRAFGSLGDLPAMWQATCGDGPRNLLRLTFHPDGIRQYLANLDELAPIFLQRTQREAVATRNQTVLNILEEISAYPGMPAAWLDTSLDSPPPPIIPLTIDNGIMRASLFTMISTFGTPQDITTDELRIESYFPADSDTEQLLQILASTAT